MISHHELFRSKWYKSSLWGLRTVKFTFHVKRLTVLGLEMKLFQVIIVFCGVYQVFSRSHGVRRDDICSDVNPDTLVIKDDDESCGSYIACIGQVAQRFKCFSDSVYSNGTAVCLSCDEESGDDFYDDGYGHTIKKTTRKKFTYKPTKRTTPPPKIYTNPTRPPVTKPYQTTRKLFQLFICFLITHNLIL